MVIVEWCGHSYLLIRTSRWTIAVDPHDGGSIGVETCRVTADLVLVTHNHFDHNAIDVAAGPSTRTLKWTAGRREPLPGVTVEGYKFYHDKAEGKLRGTVTAYKITVDGATIVHLSDIGHIPPSEALKPLEGADLLAVPVGGVYTIDALEAVKLAEALKPRLILPVHYWTHGVILPLDPLDRFLQLSKFRRERVETRSIRVEPGEPEMRPTVIVPPPPKSLWTREEREGEY